MTDKPDGPLQIEVYGNADWEKFYEKMDLGVGGTIAGPTSEAVAFQKWFDRQNYRLGGFLRFPSVQANVSSIERKMQ